MLNLYKSTDTLIRWDEMKNALTDEYVNDATVKMTLIDEDNENVSGAVDRPLANVASNGRYDGTIPNEVDLTNGAEYVLEIVATRGSYKTTARISCTATWWGEDN